MIKRPNRIYKHNNVLHQHVDGDKAQLQQGYHGNTNNQSENNNDSRQSIAINIEQGHSGSSSSSVAASYTSLGAGESRGKNSGLGNNGNDDKKERYQRSGYCKCLKTKEKNDDNKQGMYGKLNSKSLCRTYAPCLIVSALVILVVVAMVIGLFLKFVLPYDAALDPCEEETRLQVSHPIDVLEINDDDASEDSEEKSETLHKIIPKIIHQQWRTQTIDNEDFMKWHLEWKRLYPEPEWQHILWDDTSMRDLIQEHYPWFLETYDGYKYSIQRADSSRYFILHHYGGLYADLDYVPFINFWKKLPQNKVSLIESPYKFNENVQNSLMASPVSHPFWKVAFDVMLKNKHMSSILYSTGPKMLDNAIEELTKQEGIKSAKQPYILSCVNYHRIPTGNAGTYSPSITTLMRELVARTSLTRSCGSWQDKRCHYGMHHNAVSWSPISPSNKDKNGILW